MSGLELAPDGGDGGGTADEDRPVDATEDADDGHLADLADGAGCTEIWEHLSERRGD